MSAIRLLCCIFAVALIFSFASAVDFNFCHLTMTEPRFKYNTWNSVTTGTLTGTAVSGSTNRYLITSITGIRKVAALDRSGAVNTTATLGSIDSGATSLGFADNILVYPTTSTFTTDAGLSFFTLTQQTDLEGCVDTNNYNFYSDSQLICATDGAQKAVITDAYLEVKMSPSSVSCSPPKSPVLTLPATTSTTPTTYQFCHRAYSNTLRPRETVPNGWTSITSGTLTVLPTNTSNTFVIQTATGWRATAAFDGSGSVSSNVTFSMIPTTTCFPNNCDNLLHYPATTGGAFFDDQGLGIVLSNQQSDPSGITGTLIYFFQNFTATAGASNYNDQSVMQVVPAGSSLDCSAPAVPTTSNQCSLTSGATTVDVTMNEEAQFVQCSNGITSQVKLCSTVQESFCQDILGNNAMICQTDGFTAVNGAALRVNNGSIAVDWVDSADLSKGVRFSTSSGDRCYKQQQGGSGYRSASGVITCGCKNEVTWIESPDPCTYVYNISSPSVCTNGVPACPDVVTTTWYFCGVSVLPGVALSNITTSNWAHAFKGSVQVVDDPCDSTRKIIQSVTGSFYASADDGSGFVAATSDINRLSLLLGSPSNTISTSPPWVDVSGFSFRTNQETSDRVCAGANVFNIYGSGSETRLLCGKETENEFFDIHSNPSTLYFKMSATELECDVPHQSARSLQASLLAILLCVLLGLVSVLF